MAASLDSAIIKLNRANAHYEVMRDEEIRRRRGAVDAYPLTHQSYRDGLEYRFFLGQLPRLDEDWWSVRIGDCLFNLRSALDHVVYALLARRQSRQAINKRCKVGRTMFPIYDEKPTQGKKGFEVPLPSGKWREIRTLSAEQRTAIQWLQPYHRRDDKLARIRVCLSEVNRLNNIDKHRHLHVVRHTAFALTHPWFVDCGFQAFPKWGALESNTEIDRWTFTSIPPNLAREMQVQREVYAEIALDEAGEQTPIFPMLHTLIYNIGRIVARFSVWLPTTPGLAIVVPEMIDEAAERMRKSGTL